MSLLPDFFFVVVFGLRTFIFMPKFCGPKQIQRAKTILIEQGVNLGLSKRTHRVLDKPVDTEWGGVLGLCRHRVG